MTLTLHLYCQSSKPFSPGDFQWNETGWRKMRPLQNRFNYLSGGLIFLLESISEGSFSGKLSWQRTWTWIWRSNSPSQHQAEVIFSIELFIVAISARKDINRKILMPHQTKYFTGILIKNLLNKHFMQRWSKDGLKYYNRYQKCIASKITVRLQHQLCLLGHKWLMLTIYINAKVVTKLYVQCLQFFLGGFEHDYFLWITPISLFQPAFLASTEGWF